MNNIAPAILSFPSEGNTAIRRAQRRALLADLRASESPVIVDLSGCRTLNYEDIDLLLECIAQVAGRDTQVLIVAGSRPNRVLLDVTRVSSLVPIFNSIEEALAYPVVAPNKDAEGYWKSPSERVLRAA